MSDPLALWLHASPLSGAFGALRSFEELYGRYRGPVQHYLFQLCGSPDLAEELAQETFVKACTGLLNFRGDCTVATWLFRIARNCYLDSLRRPSPNRVDTDEFLAIPDTAAHGDPVRHYDALEQRGLIGIALGQLPEKQRSILLLRDAEGLSYAEIADVLGLSLAAVKVNLFRARNSFRAAYTALSQGLEP
ncbi:MAG: RNA polymerase sigma factor [Chloroflexaceae bacterium]|jgi:RNA polymerase sigma-70 factor (ECF subfamily)|nr:RNA polymerase sigma factor [Chloroflexaceae bacterium]